MMRTWSARQIAMLRELYPHLPTREVAERVGRSLGATMSRAKVLRLNKAPGYAQSEAGQRARGLRTSMAPEAMLAYLRANVRQDAHGCLRWAGTFQKNNPLVQWRKERWMARRLLWVLSGGEIPHGHFIWDVCGNRACMNLAHLRCGTRSEMHRAVPRPVTIEHSLAIAHGKSQTSRLGLDKRDDVLRMVAQGRTHAEIGRTYGVTGNTVSGALKRWRRTLGVRLAP